MLVFMFSQLASVTHAQQASQAVSLDDVFYGSFPSSKMDIRLPAKRNIHTPFAIIIHGGAWTLGDKGWGKRTQDTLTAHGMASVNIDYRYADNGSVHYQELLADIDSAVAYCIRHAAEWSTRRGSFIIIGESAGAHLALMYGFANKGKIRAIISQCAPTSFNDEALLQYYQQKDPSLLQALAKMTGAIWQPGKPIPAQYAGASPVSHVAKIPVLAFHGTADPVVPYSQALALEQAMKKKKFPVRLVPVPGAGHDLGLNTPEGRASIYAEMIRWIRQYTKLQMIN